MFQNARTKLFQAFANVYPTRRLQSSPLLRGVWRAALATLRPAHVELRLEHYRIRLPATTRFYGRSLLYRGGIEPAMSRAVLESIEPGATVVDVGANVGHYTLLAAARAGVVHAFEPDPACTAILRDNLSLQSIDNVVVHAAAVADRDGRADFFIDDDNAGGHSLVEATTVISSTSHDVPVVRLDTQFAGATVDVLKIDAQGVELQVVRGARDILARAPVAVFVEFWPHGMALCGDDPGDLLSEFTALGYHPHRVFAGKREIEDVTNHVRSVAAQAENPHAAADILFRRG
ncbi:MAG: FkbM family methyltransferase [Planctomycetota bacterium]|nr:FkbM family methyltransferase [Planctomycetota bacterium]